MFSLRNRLLGSYVLLMAMTLGVIAIALFVFLSTRAEPPTATYARLSTLVQGLNLRDLVQEFATSRPVQTTDLLQNFAETRNVRVIVLSANQAEARVAFDSAAIYEFGDTITLARDPSYNNPRLDLLLRPNVQQINGSFTDSDGAEWLYSGLLANVGGRADVWLLADLRPTRTMQETLAELGDTLALPLLQSCVIGLVVAILMAVLISRTIAKPLQATSDAASAVAEGDYNQRVPVQGPPEVRSVAEAFNRMSAEVRNAQQSQQDFMANVSHDLKTPLTSIQGYSQAIMDGAAKDPGAAAEIIHDEAGRLTRMVEELTDLARIQAGQFSLHLTAIDLGQMAKSVAQKLAVMADKKRITLEVDAPSMPPIAGDGDRLVQVMNNLIGNAIKYTRDGGSVRVITRADARGVQLVVEDTGVGIAEDDLPRIFERFYQVDKARGPKRGTGLGLAITYEIVQAHGGRIVVQSKRGQGTRFTVWLPSPTAETVISHSLRPSNL